MYYEQKQAQLEAEKEEVEEIIDGVLYASPALSEPDDERIVATFYDDDGKLLRLTESESIEYWKNRSASTS